MVDKTPAFSLAFLVSSYLLTFNNEGQSLNCVEAFRLFVSWPHKMPHKGFTIFDLFNYPLEFFIRVERVYVMLISYKIPFSVFKPANTAFNPIDNMIKGFAIMLF